MRKKEPSQPTASGSLRTLDFAVAPMANNPTAAAQKAASPPSASTSDRARKRTPPIGNKLIGESSLVFLQRPWVAPHIARTPINSTSEKKRSGHPFAPQSTPPIERARDPKQTGT